MNLTDDSNTRKLGNLSEHLSVRLTCTKLTTLLPLPNLEFSASMKRQTKLFYTDVLSSFVDSELHT